jgi:hypothetical protein
LKSVGIPASFFLARQKIFLAYLRGPNSARAFPVKKVALPLF